MRTHLRTSMRTTGSGYHVHAPAPWNWKGHAFAEAWVGELQLHGRPIFMHAPFSNFGLHVRPILIRPSTPHSREILRGDGPRARKRDITELRTSARNHDRERCCSIQGRPHRLRAARGHKRNDHPSLTHALTHVGATSVSDAIACAVHRAMQFRTAQTQTTIREWLGHFLSPTSELSPNWQTDKPPSGYVFTFGMRSHRSTPHHKVALQGPTGLNVQRRMIGHGSHHRFLKQPSAVSAGTCEACRINAYKRGLKIASATRVFNVQCDTRRQTLGSQRTEANTWGTTHDTSYVTTDTLQLASHAREVLSSSRSLTHEARNWTSGCAHTCTCPRARMHAPRHA